ncbi:MAG: T9SS type A sorting domain-containing protein [Chitinophagaceae bacterium]|nr:MAG: T9SS type A sorting domain-containing protein [Chitinophagaceae bacterium]
MMPFGALAGNLLTFNVQKQNTNAILKWKMTTESNGETMDIQRSGNGIDFMSVEKLVRTTSTDYTFTDRNTLKGENYYRLKFTAKNGNVVYSDVKQVSFDPGTEIQVYPNPVLHTVNISVKNPENVISVSITDVIGHQVYQSTRFKPQILMQHLPNGIYFLHITMDDGSVIVKKLEKKK